MRRCCSGGSAQGVSRLRRGGLALLARGHPMMFNELLKIACDIDPKTLSRVLKYLVAEKIVRREVLGTQPFTVRYALTDKGEQVRPIMQSLKAWGEAWVLPEIPAVQS